MKATTVEQRIITFTVIEAMEALATYAKKKGEKLPAKMDASQLMLRFDPKEKTVSLLLPEASPHVMHLVPSPPEGELN